MKSRMLFHIAVFIIISFMSCNPKERVSEMNIVLLHHSTGEYIWYGTDISKITRAAKKISNGFAELIGTRAHLPVLFKEYNEKHNTNYQIKKIAFPKAKPYGWRNYPYDYYNIWVKNAGEEPYMKEPTLEILTKEYDVIIFKHCFPVSNIQKDMDSADINSSYKTISNYKLQYSALRDKLHTFSDKKFILFTGAAQVSSSIREDEAKRANEFFNWVTDEWDLPGDNIYLWDLYSIETEGGIYLKNEYAVAPNDSHPNSTFTKKVVKLLFNRIIDVVENNGSETLATGELKNTIAPE